MPSYGIPEALDGTLAWSWAEARLASAVTDWVATIRLGSRPLAVPIWVGWCGGRPWFEGRRLTRRARNLTDNPAVSVGIELPDDGAVVLEGTAVRLDGPPEGLSDRLVEAFAKFALPPCRDMVDPATWSSPDGGIWAVTPRVAFGWTSFPVDATQWRFDTG